MFPGGAPPVDREERQDLLDMLRPEQEGHLEALDEAFLRYPEDLTGLLHAYVKEHRSEITGAAQCGF